MAFSAKSIAQGKVLVLLAGLMWSTGGLWVRLLENTNEWQLLFYRSLASLVTLLLFLRVSNPKPLLLFQEAGVKGFVGGVFLTLAFISMVFSLTHTNIADAVFMLSTAPFIAGFFGWILLGEYVRKSQWSLMLLAVIGIGLMLYSGFSEGALFGSLAGFVSAIGFAGFTISLRWGKSANMLTSVCYAGGLTMLFSSVALLFSNTGFVVSVHDLMASVLFGTVGFAFGMILYVAGSRQIQASELTLLSLGEVVLAPLWAWVFFQEVPKAFTLTGGAIVLSAILAQACMVYKPRSAL